ncbi:hypothetical protein CDIK_3045 [Cucumispora dikerogammari]|nr:hypothetical protein CDIK_3045 [Cucumispora dikerogammari]
MHNNRKTIIAFTIISAIIISAIIILGIIVYTKKRDASTDGFPESLPTISDTNTQLLISEPHDRDIQSENKADLKTNHKKLGYLPSNTSHANLQRQVGNLSDTSRILDDIKPRYLTEELHDSLDQTLKKQNQSISLLKTRRDISSSNASGSTNEISDVHPSNEGNNMGVSRSLDINKNIGKPIVETPGHAETDQISDIASVDPNIKMLKDQLIGKFVTLVKSPNQGDIKKQKDILKQIFQQSNANNSSGDVFNRFGGLGYSEYLKFLEYDSKRGKEIKSFYRFKEFFTSAINAYREKTDSERYVWTNGGFDFSVERYLETVRRFWPKTLDILNLVMANDGIWGFILKRADEETRWLLSLLLILIEIDKKSTEYIKCVSEFRRKVSSHIDDAIAYKQYISHMQFYFFGYYKLKINGSGKEISFDRVDTSLIQPVTLRKKTPSFVNSFFLYLNDSSYSGEIHLQSLLLGSKTDTVGGGYETTFPVFLNSPPFLTFNLKELKSSIIFQQDLSLFSLEDGETQYSLTGFLCLTGDEKNSQTRSFFKNKGEWKCLFYSEGKIESLKITSEFKTLYDKKGFRVTELFYSRIK